MIPSIKTLMQIPGLTRERAALIRAIIRGTAPKICRGCRGDMPSDRPCAHFHDGTCRYSKMDRINAALDTFGVEYAQAGSNSKSPAFSYCNAGDAYALTVMKVNGRFRVACWGDLVERGNYK